MRNWRRMVLAGAAAAALAGCLEEEVSIDLREDGTGTAVVSGRMTEAATGIVALLDEPGGGSIDLHLGPDDFSYKAPDDATREDLAGQGLRVKECVSRRDAKEVSARLAVEFDRVGSLALIEGLRRRGGTSKKKAAVGKPRFDPLHPLQTDSRGRWVVHLQGGPVAPALSAC